MLGLHQACDLGTERHGSAASAAEPCCTRRAIVSHAHREESYRQGRPCNLLLGEWAETLRHYNWHCAFCKGPFQSIDHFIPVSRGGASCVGNVVPACLSCQVAKGNLLPEEVEFIARDRMDMIARYLERRAKQQHYEPLTQNPFVKHILAADLWYKNHLAYRRLHPQSVSENR